MRRFFWLGFLFLLGACYPQKGPGGGSAEPCPEVIKIQGFAFSPDRCFVTAGTSLRFQNLDSASHTATAEGGSFDTGTLNMGDTSNPVVLNQPGSYGYFCRIHPSMRGVIEVR
jgi:plastocyanin